MNMDGKKVEVISSGKRGVVEGIRTDGGVIKYAVRYESGNIYSVLAKNIRVIEEQIELPECEYLQTGDNVPVLLLPAPCEHPALKHVATTTEGIYARCAVCGTRITVLESGDTGFGNRHLHRITRAETTFPDFAGMCGNLLSSYEPTIIPDSDERLILADAFDMVCSLNNWIYPRRRIHRIGIHRPPYQEYLPAPAGTVASNIRTPYPCVHWPVNFARIAAYRILRRLVDNNGVAIFCIWKPLTINNLPITNLKPIERAEKHVVRRWLALGMVRRIPMQQRRYALAFSSPYMLISLNSALVGIEQSHPGIRNEYDRGWFRDILAAHYNSMENSPAEAVAA